MAVLNGSPDQLGCFRIWDIKCTPNGDMLNELADVSYKNDYLPRCHSIINSIMTDNDKWLADQCLELIGDKNKGTTEYLKSIAKKAKTLKQLEASLNDFDVPTQNNPRNQFFAANLFEKFGVRTQAEIRENNNAKQKISYGLVEMSSGGNKKFAQDSEISGVKDSDMIRRKDAQQRDEFAKRLLEKDKEGKSKMTKHNNTQGVTLSQTQKLKILPELRVKSRMQYLNKVEKQKLELYEKRLKDDMEIFDDTELTKNELLKREMDKRILNLSKKNAEEGKKTEAYRFQQSQQEPGHSMLSKDKRLKALYNKYEDVPNAQPDSKAWQSSQGNRQKGTYRTVDDIELNAQKKYEMVMANSIKFIKTDLLNKAMQLKKMQKQAGEDSDSDSDSSSSSSSGSSSSQSGSKSTPKSKKQRKKQKNQIKEQKKIAQRKSPMQIVKQSLPIFKYREQLLTLIRDNQIIIMVGETGSGKTTQLPQYLHEIGYTKFGKVGCTQPRRVAAMSVATRVAEQMGVKIGVQVGYSIRFEDNTNENTIIKYMTDGMLLREFMFEPDLKSYSVMIVDEAHERSLHTDIILTLIKDICLQRSDLKVIISSATLEAQKFSQFFNGAPIIKIPGRRFPVDIYYTSNPEANYIEATVVTVLQIHLTQQNGDILCFLTGQDEIEEAMESINNRMKSLGSKVRELIVLPIYSGLPSDMQAKIFQPTPRNARKVVLATNIAETSLTIDNIVYVIDSGFVKQTAYNPRTGMDSLIVTPISKASANQRAGRAGRVSPGKCFRLYTLWSYEKQLQQSTIPQIQRSNIGNIVLSLKSMGVDNLVQFDFLDPPPHDMLTRGLEMLYALGALNDRGDLTKLGRKMAEFPLDPMLSKTLIESQKYKCVEQIITICAMLSVGNSIFFRPKDKQMHADTAKKTFYRPGGDHLTLLNVFNSWTEAAESGQWCTQNYIQIRSMRKARDVRDQLQSLLQRVQIDVSNPQLSIYVDDQNTNIRKCIVSGFFMNCAKLHRDEVYKTAKYRMSVRIHPSSMLYKDETECVVYHELVMTTQEYMRNVIEVEPEWLFQIAPHYYEVGEMKDKKQKKVVEERGGMED